MPKIVDPETRRQEVAEAVYRVVARDGLEQASLRNVAAEAGLAIGSVRHYFVGHEELMVFAMRALSDRVGKRLLAHVERLGDPAADRRRLTEDLLAELLPLDENRREETVVWLAFTAAARTRPELRPLADESFDGVRALVRRVLLGIHARGRLLGGLDLELETERFAALLDGLAHDAVSHPDRMPSELIRRVLRRHLDSLVTAG
ncbi:TetR/AcrR family transcriptional regulator [Amycolatopsis anabasis]|uniref:TetR/AcrR family transcriptional regulator n=1 Tax=Amycolatopsis anabasis TaxID=1840409 RepID=UPI00131E7B0D|nr:TetR/AcrR family transcriptional regulator [Amycolatopsis anabasis]